MAQIRDIERIREMLLELKMGDNDNDMTPRNSHDEYQYYLMEDSGILEFNLRQTKEASFYSEIKITSFGQDFIDAFESEDNFEGTKKFAKDKGQELLKMPFDIMVDLGKQYIKQQLGL